MRICSMHFEGGNGPTIEYPDPVKYESNHRDTPQSAAWTKDITENKYEMEYSVQFIFVRCCFKTIIFLSIQPQN